ncbi:C2-domain-containing protein [Armillaria mellea]|nr:C2-domain-containing protein [Armillaria mellea]
MSSIVEKIEGVVRSNKNRPPGNEHSFEIRCVDLSIQFIGASGLPKMDVVGSADPYFVAKIDDHITLVSTVKTNTLTPVWNEVWRVKNVPVTADLLVEVFDKDDGAPHDDYIGKFKTTITAGAKEAEIEGPLLRRNRGTFWLKIESEPSKSDQEYTYLFDGPIRYSRHFSPTVGVLTNLDNNARRYSTWKVYIIGIPVFFGDTYQHWNVNYKAAQSIFQGPASIAVRSTIQASHRMLYARKTTNGFGLLENPGDFIKLLHGAADSCHFGPTSRNDFAHRVKPAVYTYIISADDDSFRFSETGAAFFVDFASKHALHSNCGEFHPRPAGGWDNFNDDIPDDQVQWELVIDNNSGTYSPDSKMLPVLKELLEYNFPDVVVFALSHEDPELVKSREACRAYALKCRGIRKEDLQPHLAEGEVTLSHQAAAYGAQDGGVQ